jgi:hypothetical protein
MTIKNLIDKVNDFNLIWADANLKKYEDAALWYFNQVEVKAQYSTWRKTWRVGISWPSLWMVDSLRCEEFSNDLRQAKELMDFINNALNVSN